MRVSVLSYKMPELSGTKYGVFSKLPRHDPSHDKRYFETTYYAAFQKKFDQQRFQPKTQSMYNTEKMFSGTLSNFDPFNKIKISTKLISESYNNLNEPKYNTETQRTWINHRDPGIQAVEDYKVDNTKTIQLPKVDNELSFPMHNDYEYGTVRSKSLYGCPKKLSDVTKTTFHITNLRKYHYY